MRIIAFKITETRSVVAKCLPPIVKWTDHIHRSTTQNPTNSKVFHNSWLNCSDFNYIIFILATDILAQLTTLWILSLHTFSSFMFPMQLLCLPVYIRFLKRKMIESRWMKLGQINWDFEFCVCFAMSISQCCYIIS